MSTHPKTDLSPMSWQLTLASLGIVIGAVLFVYLICRCCRSMDPITSGNHESHDRFYWRGIVWRSYYPGSSRSEAPCVTFSLPPSAEAAPASPYEAMENV